MEGTERDLFACFALVGLVSRAIKDSEIESAPDIAYEIADRMLIARVKEDGGISSIKKAKHAPSV